MKKRNYKPVPGTIFRNMGSRGIRRTSTDQDPEGISQHFVFHGDMAALALPAVPCIKDVIWSNKKKGGRTALYLYVFSDWAVFCLKWWRIEQEVTVLSPFVFTL